MADLFSFWTVASIVVLAVPLQLWVLAFSCAVVGQDPPLLNRALDTDHEHQIKLLRHDFHVKELRYQEREGELKKENHRLKSLLGQTNAKSKRADEAIANHREASDAKDKAVYFATLFAGAVGATGATGAAAAAVPAPPGPAFSAGVALQQQSGYSKKRRTSRSPDRGRYREQQSRSQGGRIRSQARVVEDDDNDDRYRPSEPEDYDPQG